MKHAKLLFLITLLPLVAGCAALTPASKQEAAAPKPATPQYAFSDGDCAAQAENKLALFNKPDTYPISEAEKNNARSALYNQCIGAHQHLASNPKSDTQTADVASLAALSPAAGGNAAAPAYANGSTVIMVQGNNVNNLASLSPSSGSAQVQNGASSAYPGATVVVVQAPAAAVSSPRIAPTLPTALARPVPVPQADDSEAQYAPLPAAPTPQPAPVATAKAIEVTPSTHTLTAPPAAKTPAPVALNNPDSAQLEQILTK